MIAGAGASQLIEYALLGTATGVSLVLIVVHSWAEGALRPVRLALAGNTAIGDSLPRSRPTFGTWSSISLIAAIFAFSVYGAMLAAALNRGHETPVLVLAIGCGLTLGIGVPITLGAAFSPPLRPIRDLAEGTERVIAGDYSQRLPVVQDDDLGALAASFNPMQAGLTERRRLHAAFVPNHADAALRTALVIDRLVAERFGDELRIGIGINTGVVIAGTIGGGGKLEFTLIGDAVNVAARVEQLTKTTGDTILLTEQCVEALTSRPLGLIDRGSHVLKGKPAPVQVFSLDPLEGRSPRLVPGP